MSPQQLPKQEALLPESLRWQRLFLPSSSRFIPLHYFAPGVSLAKAEYSNGEEWEQILDGCSTWRIGKHLYVLLYEVVQINTQRSQPISVGYGRAGHRALSLLCAVQAQSCWDCKALESPQQREDGDTAPGSSNQPQHQSWSDHTQNKPPFLSARDSGHWSCWHLTCKGLK